jgi:hypothetical protein
VFNQRYDHDHGYDPYERAILDYSTMRSTPTTRIATGRRRC